MTEAAATPLGCGKYVDLVPVHPDHGRDDELCDAHPARHAEGGAAQVDQRHPDLTPIVGVDSRRRVWQADAMFDREPGSRTHLPFVAVRYGDLEPGRHER